MPSMERHCSTLEEYGELERAAAFTETCAPDRYLFSVCHLQPPEPIAFPLLTNCAPIIDHPPPTTHHHPPPTTHG